MYIYASYSYSKKHTKITLNFGKMHIFGKNVPIMQQYRPCLHLCRARKINGPKGPDTEDRD